MTQLTLGAAFCLGVGPEVFLSACPGCIPCLVKDGWRLLFSNSFKYLFLWCGQDELLPLVPPVGSSHNLGFGASHAKPEHG